MSAFAKADAMKQLLNLFEEIKISPSVYEELMRSKRVMIAKWTQNKY